MAVSYRQSFDDQCDECGAPRHVDVWLIVDRAERPDLWEYARQGTPNQAACANGHVRYFAAPLLLHDGINQRTFFVPFSNILMRYPSKADIQDVQDEIGSQANQLLGMLNAALPPTASRDHLRATMIVPLEDLPNVIDRPPEPPGSGPFGDQAAQRGALVQQIDRPWAAANMPARIALIESALRSVDRNEDPDWWAFLQWRLGTSYGKSSAGDETDNVERAIEALHAAAAVYGPKRTPSEWADVQLNLSTMYIRRTSSDRGADLRAAIEAAQAALSWHTAERSPDRHRIAQGNLAEAERQLAFEQEHPGIIAFTRERFGLNRRNRRPPSPRAERGQPTGRLKELFDRLAALERAGEVPGRPGERAGAGHRRERIALLEEAIGLVDPDADPMTWARLQIGLGNDLAEEGRDDGLEGAMKAYREARSVLTPRSPTEWATTFLNSAAAWFNRRAGHRDDNLRAAIDILREGLESLAGSNDDESRARLSYSLGLAWLERRGGDPHENLTAGVAALRDAQAVWTRERDPDRWAEIETQIGQGYIDSPSGELAARYEQAIEAFEASLRVYSRHHLPLEWARVQRKLGYLYGHRLWVPRGEDQYERAIHALESARTVFTREQDPQTWAETSLDLAWPYRYRTRGDPAANREVALELVLAALEVLDREVDAWTWARAQLELGIAWFERLDGDPAGNLDRAKAAFEAAQEVRRRETDPFGWATAEAEIGNVLVKADRPEEALTAYQRSIETLEAICGSLNAEDLINLGTPLMSLAQVYLHRSGGDRAENEARALDLLDRAAQVMPRETYPGRWANVQMLLLRTLLARTSGDRRENLDRAIEHGRAALDVHPPDSPDLESSILAMALAEALAERGSWVEVLDLLEKVAAAADERYAGALTEDARIGAIEWDTELYERLVTACLRVDPPRPREAFLYAEAGRSRLLRDQLGALPLPPPDGVPRTVLELEGQLLDELRQLQSPGGAAETAVDRSGLERLNAVRDQLAGTWEEMRRRYRADDYVALRQGERLDWDGVRRWLEAQDRRVGLLEFFGLGDSLVAFVVRRGEDDPTAVELGSAGKAIARDAQRFLGGLGRERAARSSRSSPDATPGLGAARGRATARARRTPPSRLRVPQAGAFRNGRTVAGRRTLRHSGTRRMRRRVPMAETLAPLGAEILGPVASQLDDLEVLYLVPYGALHHLPLHALDLHGVPLIERVAVAYAPSVAVAIRMSTRAPAAVAVEVPAPPLVVGDPGGDLPFARQEALELGRTLGVEALVGPAASKGDVVERLARSTRAHFATHAHFDAADPFASGLRLADGVLTAREIVAQRTETRLMVLSACETGVQDVRAGDELIGLARALSYVGVASLVVTLWRVDDEATRDLMVRFYRHLRGSEGPQSTVPEALRAAVRETRATAADPYLWAPFIVFGDWRVT